jgi:hypothetical protein
MVVRILGTLMIASSLFIGVANAKAPIPGPISISPRLPIVPIPTIREAAELNPPSLRAGLLMLGGMLFLLDERRRKR